MTTLQSECVLIYFKAFNGAVSVTGIQQRVERDRKMVMSGEQIQVSKEAISFKVLPDFGLEWWTEG